MHLKTLLSLLLTLVHALSLPSPTLHPIPLLSRQSSGATCGSDAYTAKQISTAQSAGCNYLAQGQTVGDDDYPHQYNDDEGFDFPVSGPWYEFPILEKEVFDGSEGPGADRVVFNANCQLAGVITHTGAPSYDGFVECEYD